MVRFGRNKPKYGSTSTEERPEPPVQLAPTPTPSPPGGWPFGLKFSGSELPQPNGGEGSEPSRSWSISSLLWMAWKHRNLFFPVLTLITVFAGYFQVIPGMPWELDCGDPFDIQNCTLVWPPSEHQPTGAEVAPLQSTWEIVNLKLRWQWKDEGHEVLLREWEQPERAIQREAAAEDTWLDNDNDLAWGHVEVHPCNAPQGTREYTAVLMNLPTERRRFHGMAVEACEVTPLDIHGAKLLPKSCLDRGNGVVIGLWEIDQFKSDCKT